MLGQQAGSAAAKEAAASHGDGEVRARALGLEGREIVGHQNPKLNVEQGLDQGYTDRQGEERGFGRGDR
jgi:hypothetical protein